MICTGILLVILSQANIVASATQEKSQFFNRASLSKESLKVDKKDSPNDVGINICYEDFWKIYYCQDGYICCTPGSPTSKCCPETHPLCIDDKYCCASGHPKVCHDKSCCESDSYCCDDGHCCKEKKSCCGDQQCCTPGNSCCSTGEEKSCCNDNSKACCDGGYGCVEPCTSPFDAVGCFPAPTSLSDDSAQLESLLSSLTVRYENEKLQVFIFLYRVLRPEETPQIGLIAKNRSACKTPLSHVNCGSRENYGSQFISTTADLDVALSWQSKYSLKNLKIAVIDVSLLPKDTVVIDLTTEANRDHYLGNAVCKNFAKASMEVLLANPNEPIPFEYYKNLEQQIHNDL